MKKALIIYFLFFGAYTVAIAQNDRDVLNYTVTESGKQTFNLSLALISINMDGINMHWSSPSLGEGNILVSPASWKIGTHSYWKQLIPDTDIRLEKDQTIVSFSQNFYRQIKEKSKAEYDGIKYVESRKNNNHDLIIGGEIVNTVFLESVDGNVKAWMFNNPKLPLIIKMIGHPSGYDLELNKLSTFFFWENVYDFKKRPVPESYIPIRPADIGQIKEIDLYSRVTDYLPDNYVKDGSKDYTEFIQKCLDSSHYVLMPDFPVLINDQGLDIGNKRTIFFQKNSKLLLHPSKKGHYQMIRIHNVKDVTVLNGNLVGDRDTHKGKDGEWGMGITIKGSKNIVVKNTKISNCWGDGIYIGRLENVSSNILIEDCFIDNNRRNGLSIISAKRLKVINCLFSNTNGTDPQCGVDVEPNKHEDILRGISFKNNITYNNHHSGLLIYLSNSPSSEKREKVIINIDNNYDDHSLYPLRISGNFLRDEKTVKPLKGYIKINRLRSKTNKPSVINKNKLFPTIILKD